MVGLHRRKGLQEKSGTWVVVQRHNALLGKLPSVRAQGGADGP